MVGLIRPGDFVDVMGVSVDGNASTVLLQRVLVLATGMETSTERSDNKQRFMRSSLLTLSVSLQEAQLLSLAQTASRLTVVVRAADDPRVMEAPPDVKRSELFDSTVPRTIQSSRRRPVRLQTGAVR